MVRILLIAAVLVAALEGTSAASQKPDDPQPAAPTRRTVLRPIRSEMIPANGMVTMDRPMVTALTVSIRVRSSPTAGPVA